MSTPSFWRKSSVWWLGGLAMLCVGVGSAMNYADEGHTASLVLSILAFGLAALCAVVMAWTWTLHRRS